MIADEELAEWKRLGEAATPGPWTLDLRADGILSGIEGPDIRTDCEVYGPKMPDATFIAAARTAVPALIAEVERLRSGLAAYFATFDQFQRENGITEDSPTTARLRALLSP